MISQKMIAAVEKVFEHYGEQIASAAKESLATLNKNATNTLSDSFTWKVTSNDETVTLSILSEDYLKYLETKRQWNQLPNIRALVRWIEYKGFELWTKPGTRHGSIEANGVISRPGVRRGNPVIIRRNVGVSNERLAFAIAKKIMKNGNKPVGILKPIVESSADEITQKLLEAVKESIENDIADTWNEGASTEFLTYTITF